MFLGQGKIDQAIAEYWQVVKSEYAANETWLELARMLVLRNLRLPAENRNWDEVDGVIKHAAELLPATPQIPLLAAEVLVAQNKVPEAERLLERFRDEHPEQIEFWVVLAGLAERQEEWDKAEKLLNDAKHRLGDRPGLRIALRRASRAAFWREGGGAGEATGGEDGKVSPRTSGCNCGAA